MKSEAQLTPEKPAALRELSDDECKEKMLAVMRARGVAEDDIRGHFRVLLKMYHLPPEQCSIFEMVFDLLVETEEAIVRGAGGHKKLAAALDSLAEIVEIVPQRLVAIEQRLDALKEG